MNAFDYLFNHSRHLNKNFVLGSNEEASFNKIYSDSLQVATYLKAKLGENQNILLISSNSLFFIKAYLGILKSGNICIPINPSIEQTNVDHILKTAKCALIFLSNRTNVNLNICESIIDEPMLEDIIRSNLSSEIFPETFDENRTAEILFTSGSTNLPKGVMLSHRNISSNTESIIAYLKLTHDDTIGIVLPFYYCYGLSLLHTHLRVGGSIVLCNSFIFFGTVIEELKKYKCTGFAGVPSHFQILLRKSQTFSATEFPELRYVTQAGGKLHNVFIEEFTEFFPNIRFFVMYGQTEATARLAYLPPELLTQKMGSIGKEIPGVSLKVVNSRGRPVKVGEVGEILAKGSNIMKGYYNDPKTTEGVLKDGWLYTGDLARIDSDGYLYLVSRKKEIIKVGGRRVSPKEIEEVILSVDEVIDCTIEGVFDELLGEGIEATIVLKDGCDRLLVKDIILKKCKTNLATFKIPQKISFENSLMLNSAGKKIKHRSTTNL